VRCSDAESAPPIHSPFRSRNVSDTVEWLSEGGFPCRSLAFSVDLALDEFLNDNRSEMAPERRARRLREAGINPTIQRIAVLEFLESTKTHPTADEVFRAMRKSYPTIAKATVYNTLDALTQAGTILRLTIDPTASRYDADLSPHVHFHCRACGKTYDIATPVTDVLEDHVDGHRIESVRTYAYGVCAECLKGKKREIPHTSARSSNRQSASKKRSATDPTTRKGGG
jgi:Fur family peroxide stress response transcriptional regulator